MLESWRLFGPKTPHSPSARRYVHADGIPWCVRELAADDRTPALYFETTTAFRRVTEYPPDWRDLPTGELEILSHRP